MLSEAVGLRARDGHPAAMNGESAPALTPIARSALWAAWGDALGFPTELVREEGQVRRRVGPGRIEEPVEWKRRMGGRQGPIVPLPAGTYSDDTQLRLAVGRCIRSAGRFDVEAFSKIELPIFLSYGFGIGRGTRAAGHALQKRSVRWYSNFYSTPSATYIASGGNGAAMRIQPHVWASGSAKPETYLPGVLRDAVTTHGHPRGIAGAALHALSLGATLRQRAVPSPARWVAMARYLENLTDVIQADETLAQRWLPEWERTTGQSWEQALEEVTTECEEMLAAAAAISTRRWKSFDVAYRALATEIGGLDPATRGSATVSAVLALWLAWNCNGSAEDGIRVAANLLGSDTDTVASMAGALAGVSAGSEPPGVLADRDLVEAEATRLERLAEGTPTPSFPHPDPLRWVPPSTLADAVGRLDGRVAIAGLGLAHDEGAIFEGQGKDPPLWQWLRLEFGQRVLIKRRRDLDELPASARPRERQASPPPAQLTIDDSKRSERPDDSKRSERPDEPLPEFVEDGVQLALDRDFDADLVGRLLFHYAQQDRGVTKASLFAGLLADALARRRHS